MKKETMILYIALSVLSLLITALVYFGLVRYCQLHLFSCCSYGKEYLSLPRANTNSKVIVSLETSAKDLEDIRPCINSILDQTVHPDQIIISVPPENENIKIPPYLQEQNIIITHKLPEDYNLYTNFVSPLLREKDGSTKIILLSDQFAYGVDFLESLIDASDNHPNDAIYVQGYNAKAFLENDDMRSKGEENDVISVRHGVLIKPTMLDADVLKMKDAPKFAPDAILSSQLHKNKTKLHHMRYDENYYVSQNSKAESKQNHEKNALIIYAYHFPSI